MTDVGVCVSLTVNNCIANIEPSIVILFLFIFTVHINLPNPPQKLHVQCARHDCFSYVGKWILPSSDCILQRLWMTYPAFIKNQPKAKKREHIFTQTQYDGHVTDCVQKHLQAGIKAVFCREALQRPVHAKNRCWRKTWFKTLIFGWSICAIFRCVSAVRHFKPLRFLNSISVSSSDGWPIIANY